MPFLPGSSTRCSFQVQVHVVQLLLGVIPVPKSSEALEVFNSFIGVLMYPAVKIPQSMGQHQQAHRRRRQMKTSKCVVLLLGVVVIVLGGLSRCRAPGNILTVFGFPSNLRVNRFGGCQGVCAARCTQHLPQNVMNGIVHF